jgi:hypothetical protein
MGKPATEISVQQAFALLLETACRDFEILLAFVEGELQVLDPKVNSVAPVKPEDSQKAFRIAHAPWVAQSVIMMALAKAFLFSARRANRVCTSNARSLRLDRIERKLFLTATQRVTAVRDVNEHGFDGSGSKVKRSMHAQDGGTLDETSLMINGPRKILMGPLNLVHIYQAVDRMRKLAGFGAIPRAPSILP